MDQVNIFSNINGLEQQKNNYPEFLNLLSTMEMYKLKFYNRSIYSKSEQYRQNIEHNPFYTVEFARRIAQSSKNSIAVLFFPQVFVSGFMLPLIEFLSAKNIKYFIIGLSDSQKHRILLKPNSNFLRSPAIYAEDEVTDPLLNKSEKLVNLNNIIQNVSWSGILSAQFLSNLTGRISTAIEKGYTQTSQISPEIPREFFINLNILNLIIIRYRHPLNEIRTMLSGESQLNVKALSRVFAFFFLKNNVKQLTPILTDINGIEKNSLNVTNKESFFLSVFRQIEKKSNPATDYSTFLNNFIKLFIKSRIHGDPIVASKLETLPELGENELIEHNKNRQFISSVGLLRASTDFNKKLTEEEKKGVFIYFINIFRKSGVNGNSGIDKFLKETGESFFRSAVIGKIVRVLKENPVYWNIASLKKVILKVDFNLEEIENIFTYLRRIHVVDYVYFERLSTMLEQTSSETDLNNLVQLFKIHQKKKLKILSEFEYIFIHEKELSYVEKIMTTLGKYQLGMKLFKNQEVSLKMGEFSKMPVGYNKIWQGPISKLFFNKQNVAQIITAHNFFIEKTVNKYFKEIIGTGISNIVSDYGKNSFSIIYEKIIENYHCNIGYTQFHDILKNKLFFTDRQLESFGYSSSIKYPEDFVHYNDFYSGNSVDQMKDVEKYTQFNQIIQNITENYGTFIDEYTKLIEQNFLDENEKNSLLMIGKNLKEFNRDALLNFRKKNVFSVFLKDMLTKFCVENLELIKRKNNNVVLALNEKYYFLKYFMKDLLIERNGQIIYLSTCFNPKQAEDKLNAKLIEMLDNISDTEFRQDFEKLVLAYKYIFQINKYVNQLQKLAGVLLVHDIVMQNYTKVEPYRQEIEKMGFNILPDPQKMIISTPETLSKLKVSEILKTPGELSRIHESFSNFNESLSVYSGIPNELDEMCRLMEYFNETYATIPNIIYAPLPLKQIRYHVKEISKILELSFGEFVPADITNLDQHCYEIWKNYMNLTKLEGDLQAGHRFFDIGMKSYKLKYGTKYAEKILLFFKQGFDQVKNKKKLPSSFSSRFEIALNLHEKLSNKELFFFVPVRGLKSLNIDCVKNIKKIKGLNTAVYVDNSENEEFRDSLFGYIPPNNFINLTR